MTTTRRRKTTMSKSIAAEYQAMPWIMEPAALKAFAERVASLPQTAALFAVEVAEKPKELTVVGGVAKIAIRGYLLDTVPGWVRAWGITATGYDEIVSQIHTAVERKDVTGIELLVDSPGGMVAGVISAADAIFEARQSKPVSAVIKVLGASGAYWLASQAETIIADDANTGVGSIGVFTWYYSLQERVGIKISVIRSGEHKGMGLDTITDKQLAAVQERIDGLADNFITAVARGRASDVEQIAELATGQLWIAGKARELGLIDAVIESPAAANGDAGNPSQQSSEVKGETLMKNDKDQDSQAVDTEKVKAEAQKAAQNDERIRASQLKTEFADDPEFALKAVTEGWSVAEAKAEYCDVLKARVAEQAKEIASGKDSAAASGADAIVSEDTDGGDGGGDFLAEAREMAEEKKISITDAMKKLNRQKPGLHAAFKQRCETEGKEMYAEAV
jgi:signal peptide peptidase SppA